MREREAWLQGGPSFSGGERMKESLRKGEDRLKVLRSQIKEGTDGGGLMRSMDSMLETEGG